MAKNYTWHLICETHDIDEWISCQTTGNDAAMSEAFIKRQAREIQDDKECSRTLANLIVSVEETDIE